MLAKSLKTYTCFPVRQFGFVSSYVGPNDNIRKEKREMRKFGMKRHFYDHLKLDPSAIPTE